MYQKLNRLIIDSGIYGVLEWEITHEIHERYGSLYFERGGESWR